MAMGACLDRPEQDASKQQLLEDPRLDRQGQVGDQECQGIKPLDLVDAKRHQDHGASGIEACPNQGADDPFPAKTRR